MNGITSVIDRSDCGDMNKSEANRIAHSFLCDHIELELCNEPPNGLYEFNHSDEILFRFCVFGHMSVGGSEYIAVSNETGAGRYLGFLGE